MTDVDTLMALEREAYHRTIARDFAWMRDHHRADALMFQPGQPIARAHDIFNASEQREAAQATPDNADSPQTTFFFEPTHAEVSASGDMGWVHGVIVFTHPGGHESRGKYVSVWTKEQGQWKVVAEIRNADA